jgi:hypothetical protein
MKGVTNHGISLMHDTEFWKFLAVMKEFAKLRAEQSSRLYGIRGAEQITIYDNALVGTVGEYFASKFLSNCLGDPFVFPNTTIVDIPAKTWNADLIYRGQHYQVKTCYAGTRRYLHQKTKGYGYTWTFQDDDPLILEPDNQILLLFFIHDNWMGYRNYPGTSFIDLIAEVSLTEVSLNGIVRPALHPRLWSKRAIYSPDLGLDNDISIATLDNLVPKAPIAPKIRAPKWMWKKYQAMQTAK